MVVCLEEFRMQALSSYQGGVSILYEVNRKCQIEENIE